MKKFFNYYMISACVLMGISLLLIIFGAGKNIYTGIAFIALGLAIILALLGRIQVINATIRSYTSEIDNALVNEPNEILNAMYKELKKVKRNALSIKVSFSIAGVLLIIFGFVMII